MANMVYQSSIMFHSMRAKAMEIEPLFVDVLIQSADMKTQRLQILFWEPCKDQFVFLLCILSEDPSSVKREVAPKASLNQNSKDAAV